MRKCNACGYQNEPSSVFCMNCGAKLMVEANERKVYTPQPAPAQKKKSNKGLVAALIISIVVLFLVLVIAGVILAVHFFGFEFDMFSGNGGADTVYVPTQETEVVEEEVVEEEAESFYTVYKSDATWTEANANALKQSGYLISINDATEFDEACKLAEGAGLNVFWVGAKIDSSSLWSDAYWLDGTPVTYTKWFTNEPTYYSEEGEEENYLMVFCVNGEWFYNDSINDVSEYYTGKMGYIVEVKG